MYINDKKIIKAKDMKKLSEYRDYLRQRPKLTFLFVELTNQCNLACFHCGSSCKITNGTNIDTNLLLSALETIAEDFDSGKVMICLTDGEPMLHPDFYKIVRKINKLGFPWGMTTNGTLITEKVAYKLKKLHLQSITISLDGLEQSHEWLRNVRGCFKQVVEAVNFLNCVEIPVQITSVIHKKNFLELDEMYELMCDMKISSWRIINMEPIGRALQKEELFYHRMSLYSC